MYANTDRTWSSFYAQGVSADENNKTWRESDTYTYQVKGMARMIIIDEPMSTTKTYHLELEIVAMTRNSLLR
jgi:hypothetical protein